MNQARVFFGPVAVEAIPGRDLLSLLLDARAPILYLCMAGSCGTCRVRVCSGDEHLGPVTDAEESMLPLERAHLRLACQAETLGTGDVVVTQDGLGPV